MTVNPGFGGQAFIPEVLNKVEQIAEWRKERQLDFEIEVDGGVDQKTAKTCAEAGADVLVAGSAVYKRENRSQAIEEIVLAAEKAE